MRKIGFLVLTFFFCHGFVLSQNSLSFDELATAFNKANSDTAKLQILFSEKPIKYTDRADELLPLYHEGYRLAKRNNDKVNRFKATHYIALTYLYGKIDEATAFQWLQKALVEAEAAQNNLFIGWVYYAMGIIHHHQNNFSEMYKAMYTAIEYLEKAPDPVDGPFVSLSQALENEKKWQDQLAVNRRLVKLMERTQSNPFVRITAYNSLVDALKHHPDKKEELALYHSKTMALVDKISLTNLYPDDRLIVASIYFKNNRPELAVKIAQEVASLPDTAGFNLPVKGLAYKFLSEIYEKQKQYLPALTYYKQYQDIESQQMVKRLTDDAGKKIIQAEAERDVAIKQKEVEKQQLFTYLAAAVALLILVLSGSIYYFYRREQSQKQELQGINATKDKLFAILSHDLRSPIMGLKNYLMLINWGALSQNEFRESAQSLTFQLGNVYDMLENVLHWSVSQLSGFRPQKETVLVHSIIEEQTAILSSVFTTKNINIQNSIPSQLQLTIDKNHLIIIIRNLLHNALKFSHSNGIIQLSYSTNKNNLFIEIKDTGIGMSEEQIKTLFNLNKHSSQSGTNHEKGTGLGLILVKELVETNGGNIMVSSQPNEGTLFRLQFKK
ncbi:MAG: HAMP domain-containing histidine kinase [Bacteroidetes bacterium]|nr:HAMP domain-containing histidine kinase [Bacteroidota bacterium]